MTFKCVEVTPGGRRVLESLKGGEKISVTFREGEEPLYEMTGGGKRQHRSDVIAAAFQALKQADLLQEVDKGLFEGCGQTFVVVR